jgi:hypothetical protein
MLSSGYSFLTDCLWLFSLGCSLLADLSWLLSLASLSRLLSLASLSRLLLPSCSLLGVLFCLLYPSFLLAAVSCLLLLSSHSFLKFLLALFLAAIIVFKKDHKLVFRISLINPYCFKQNS